jgi:hypothetical protein
LGGRREQATRYELGRFVPSETPEFGRLDGISVDHRLESGRQIGWSAGHLPGWTDASEFSDDWQLALNFNSGLRAQRGLDWRTAYQKTWHQGRSDRDLLLLGSRWSPRLGDSLAATAWVDWYDSEDGPKDVGPELTRLHLYASHTLSPGSGLRISHSRNRLPFVRRQTYDTPAEDLNLDGEVQRTGISHWRMLDRDHRLHLRADTWRDERDSGWHGEIGHEWLGLLPRGSDLEAMLSGSDGSFSELLSLRLGVRTFHEGSQWQVSLQTTRLVETTSVGSRDPIWQHDLRASLHRQVLGNWNLALHLDLGLGEDQDHRSLGFHLGRRF